MAEGIRDRYAEHMEGRNGGDAISRTCLIAALVLIVLSFLCVGVSPFLYVLVLLFGIASAVYAALRMNSRSVAKRRLENERFLELFSRFTAGRSAREGDADESARRPRSSSRPRRAARPQREDEAETEWQQEQPEPEPAPVEKITIECESCGQRLSVPAGKGTIKVKCPKCSTMFVTTT